MSEQKKRYVVTVRELEAGQRSFQFDIDGSLFSRFDNSEVKDARVAATVEVEKGAGKAAVRVQLDGTASVECDRCLEAVELPVKFQGELEVRFGVEAGEQEYDGEALRIGPREDIDLSTFFYESVLLALPYQRVHPEGECDPEMLERFTTIQEEDFMKMISEEGDDQEDDLDETEDEQWEDLQGLSETEMAKLRSLKDKLEQK